MFRFLTRISKRNRRVRCYTTSSSSPSVGATWVTKRVTDNKAVGNTKDAAGLSFSPGTAKVNIYAAVPVPINEVKDISTEDSQMTSITYKALIEKELRSITPMEETLQGIVAQMNKDYDGIDVREPTTLTNFEGYKPTSLSLGNKVRSVADFISGHIAHHVMNEDWVRLFDLERLEMDVVFFLWILHLHLIARRSNMVSVTLWAHRRDVLQELLYSMRTSWEQTAESLMGRPPLQRMRNFVLDMYHVVAIGLEEALCHEGPGGDLALLSVLMRLMPLPRPEDLPMYTYFVLVHYIRFHAAVLDRTSDEAVLKGNYNFISPLDPSLAQPYSEVQFDEMIRSWQAKVPEEKETPKPE